MGQSPELRVQTLGWSSALLQRAW